MAQAEEPARPRKGKQPGKCEGLCQSHHLQWLSRGGDDELGKMLLLCPNQHAAAHQCDAPFGFRDDAFDFGHREPLQINLHLA